MSDFDLIFDIETDSLMQRGGPKTIHCIEALVPQTGDQFHFVDNHPGYRPLADFDELLRQSRYKIAHNALAFDLRVLKRLRGLEVPAELVRDTLIASRTAYPDLTTRDESNPAVPKEFHGKHSLEAWGYRTGIRKSGFGKACDWNYWSPEMSDYCEQDVMVNAGIYLQQLEEADSRGTPIFQSDAYALDRDLIALTNRMTDIGVPFNVQQCHKLLAELQTSTATLAAQLQDVFPPKLVCTPFTPKRNNKTKGYIAGHTIQRCKEVPYNPASSQQTAERLQELGWRPREYTESGAPSVKAAVLLTLDYPEAQVLANFKTAEKRITMITGPKGWLASVEAAGDGRLHTEYKTNLTITGRASHSPNIAQVPKVRKDKVTKQPLRGVDGAWGYEIRSLFSPPEGWLLVGADMAGLELRCLGHRLATYDGGDYAALVSDPDGDPHSVVQESAGLATRDHAKTLAYAVIYGCGDVRAGRIALPDDDDLELVRWVGRQMKADFFRAVAGYQPLLNALRGNDKSLDVKTIDGRILTARKEYTKLNTMLQGDGAVLCKRWLLILDADLQAKGLRPGEDGDYELLAWIHDECQIAARTPEIAEIVAETCKAAAVKAGEYYNLDCPTAGKAKIGATWAETH